MGEMKREDIDELKKLEEGITRRYATSETLPPPYATGLRDVVAILRRALQVSEDDASLLANEAVKKFGMEATINASELLRRRKTATWSEAFAALGNLKGKEKDNVDGVS